MRRHSATFRSATLRPFGDRLERWRGASRAARIACAAAFGLVSGFGAVFAAPPPDDADPRGEERPSVAPADREPPPPPVAPRMLVLVNDRIVEGRIARTGHGYQVTVANGTYTIPFERVKFEARDLQDAYRKQQSLIQDRTPRTHVALAHWCLTFNLVEEAKHELREALRLSPSDEAARAFLKRLEELLRTEDPVAGPRRTDPEKSADGFARPAARSLAGLSRPTATAFTLKIQPLLVNTCGAASCHGSSSENPFRLYAVRLGYSAHRVHSERNLATVLEYVDAEQPDRSPLLIAPQGNHGKGGRAVFHGSGGAEQQALLKEWVHAVARDLGGEEPLRAEAGPPRASLSATMRFPEEAPPGAPLPHSARPSGFVAPPSTTTATSSAGPKTATGPQRPSGPPVSRPTSPLAILPAGGATVEGEAFAPFGPTPGHGATSANSGTAGTGPSGARNRPAPPSADPELRRILDDSRSDAFDPDAFNRQRPATKR